ITADEDLINRRYFEDNLPIATGDVTTVGNPQPGQLALWTGLGAIEGNPGLTVEEDQLLTSGGITVNSSGESASGTLHLTQTNSGHAAIHFGENWALNTFEGPGGEVTDFAITNNTSGEHVLFIENGNRITISDASGGLGMQYAGDYSDNNTANERWIPDKAYVDNAIASVGGGDVIRVGTPANNQLAIWTGNGSIEGDADFTWDGTQIRLNTAGLLKGSISTNGDNNGFELTGNNNGADTTIHFKGIVQTGGDTGTNPIFSYTGNYNNTSELSARPILNAFNNDTMLFQVAADGSWDYQGNDVTNINIATISNVAIGGLGIGANSIHTLSGDLILESASGIVAVGNARISGSYFSANTTDAIYYGAGTSFSGGGGIHTYGNGNITNGGGLDIRPRSGGLLRFFHTNTIRAIMDGDGTWDYQGNALTNISNPVNPQDAATRAYVDSTVAGVGGGGVETEFGDFAPIVQATEGGENVAYQHQYGIYYKIGQLVTVFIAITVADVAGGNGNFQIADLPFSTMENPEGLPDFVGTVSSNNPNFQGTAIAQTHGGNSMNIVNYEGQNIPWAALSNFDSFQVSLTYLTN
ncbi:MAG: hypothetical protein AAF934_11225, partial [Bacteroidota bacterium]